MKTLNNHPHWYNQPLRLSKNEMRNPHLVIEDFFGNYHLQDVRQILWGWLVAVISSPLNISNNPLDRSSHIYFYEKVEELIEAALVIQKTAHVKANEQRRNERHNS